MLKGKQGWSELLLFEGEDHFLYIGKKAILFLFLFMTVVVAVTVGSSGTVGLLFHLGLLMGY